MSITKIAALTGCMMMCSSAIATAAYTYENDNKTYVATVTMRTLTINGVQQPRGDYTFGSGTLSVLQPSGLLLNVR